MALVYGLIYNTSKPCINNRFEGPTAKMQAMNRFWLSQGAHTAWDSSAETPHTSLEILLITGTF